MKITIKIILTTIVLLIITGCGASKIYNVPTQNISKSISDESLFNAIKKGGASHRWEVSKVERGVAKAIYNKRRHQAVVLIHYGHQTYDIQYSSSKNLKYKASRNTIHKNYNKWIKNLKKSIDREIQLSRGGFSQSVEHYPPAPGSVPHQETVRDEDVSTIQWHTVK